MSAYEPNPEARRIRQAWIREREREISEQLERAIEAGRAVRASIGLIGSFAYEDVVEYGERIEFTREVAEAIADHEVLLRRALDRAMKVGPIEVPEDYCP